MYIVSLFAICKNASALNAPVLTTLDANRSDAESTALKPRPFFYFMSSHISSPSLYFYCLSLKDLFKNVDSHNLIDFSKKFTFMIVSNSIILFYTSLIALILLLLF